MSEETIQEGDIPKVTRGLKSEITKTTKQYDFPTEVISLPSKGLVYPESNPLSRGEVTIKLMTAKEEDILTSTNLIRKGTQLDKLLEAVVVEPGVNVDDLLVGDKNAILISSRILAFGTDYITTIADPDDDKMTEVTIDLSQINVKEIDDSVYNRKNEYDFILPSSNIPIKFKLITHGDELAINRDIDASLKTTKQGNEITTRWRRIIIEVAGNRDAGHISNFVLNQLRAADSRALRKYITQISPDLDLTFKYTSPVSGEEATMKIPFGINFFYPAD